MAHATTFGDSNPQRRLAKQNSTEGEEVETDSPTRTQFLLEEQAGSQSPSLLAFGRTREDGVRY